MFTVICGRNSVMELGDNLTAVGAKVERLESKVEKVESKFEKLEATTRAGFESVNADLMALRGDMEQVHIRLDNIDKA